MVKTASGKRTTVRGSGESKRAVAHNRTVPSPGASKASAIAIPSSPASAAKKNSGASALSMGSKAGSKGPAGTAKAARPVGRKTPGQSKDQVGLMAGETGRSGKAGNSAGKRSECNGSGC